MDLRLGLDLALMRIDKHRAVTSRMQTVEAARAKCGRWWCWRAVSICS